VGEYGDAPSFQFVSELDGCRLAVETGDHHAENGDVPTAQIVDELQGVGIVGNAEIGPYFLSFDVPGVDAQQDVGLILQLPEKTHLHVGIVAGQDPGGVIVVEKLAAEFEVELVLEPRDALQDLRRLFPDVLFVVKSRRPVHLPTPCLIPADFAESAALTILFSSACKGLL